VTLEQLRIFIAVAERQHVTQAGQALNLAQSAPSHAIAAREARHDTKLFDRVGRPIDFRKGIDTSQTTAVARSSHQRVSAIVTAASPQRATPKTRKAVDDRGEVHQRTSTSRNG
jgi:hypothetical protein